jgi:ribosomal protein S14
MLHRKLQELPRNSSRVRLHNRCLVTGRPKGYSRDFDYQTRFTRNGSPRFTTRCSKSS